MTHQPLTTRQNGGNGKDRVINGEGGNGDNGDGAGERGGRRGEGGAVTAAVSEEAGGGEAVLEATRY